MGNRKNYSTLSPAKEIMNYHLTKNDSELVESFLGLGNKYEIASLLEVPFSTIVYLLYRPDRPTPYVKFNIKKKSGGIREIFAPVSNLKILQSKLAHILYLIYRPRFPVYGFCKGRNILGNARLHAKKKVVFNIDLENFFPTVHLGRVIGLFQARPFNFPRDVAVMLAQICCFEGKLPQGAPTSPVIANMICAGMDKDLQKLAKDNHCVYTRYADDITFSTTAKFLSPDIVEGENGIVKCGAKLTSIVEKHSFKIKTSKVRLQDRKSRQEVTGLVVNEFANVSRKYVREVRGILHALKKFGDENATKVYYEKYCRRHHINSTPPLSLIVRGKISFIKSIRGEKDPIYRKLLNAYNKEFNPGLPILPVTLLDELKSALWIIETASGYVGTAFMLRGKGLVTCSHVVNGTQKVRVHHWASNKSFDALVILKSGIADLAVLEVQNISPGEFFLSLEKSISGTVKERDVVSIAGFPGYQTGDPPQCWDARVSAKRGDPTGGTGIYVERYTVDRLLFGGMSGSPVVDEENKVVGVATYGSPTVVQATSIWDYGITPIYHLDNIA